jgi:methylphosphotriester-DNA--protein-cysteine methyltransferase
VRGEYIPLQVDVKEISKDPEIFENTSTADTLTADFSEGRAFVVSIGSSIYHYPKCEWALKIRQENNVWFSSPRDAVSHCYKPCSVCLPP